MSAATPPPETHPQDIPAWIAELRKRSHEMNGHAQNVSGLLAILEGKGKKSARFTIGGLLSIAAIVCAFGLWLVSTSAKGGVAAAEFEGVKATAAEVPAIRTKLAVHDQQFTDIHAALEKMDRRLEKIGDAVGAKK